LSFTSGSSKESEGRGGGRGSDGRGGGRGGGGRGKRKKYCWNYGGEHHVIQCTRTILKEKEKGDQPDTYDDESAFISEVHSNGLHEFRFASSPKHVYFSNFEFESHNINVNVMHSVALLSTVCNTLLDNSAVYDSDYSFLRVGRYDSLAGAESIDLVCLMAQVSTDYGIASANRVIDNESTNHMNRFECYDNVDQNEPDYSFLWLDSCECSDDSDIQYETFDFNVMSDIGDFGIDCSNFTDLAEPIALVAQVSYDIGDDSAN
jgi:hypothetical protein